MEEKELLNALGTLHARGISGPFVDRIMGAVERLIRERDTAIAKEQDYHGKTVRAIGEALGIDCTLPPVDFLAACRRLAEAAKGGAAPRVLAPCVCGHESDTHVNGWACDKCDCESYTSSRRSNH